MPDAQGNYQVGEFLPHNTEDWQLDFSDGKSYLLHRLHPSGSRASIVLLNYRGSESYQLHVGTELTLDFYKNNLGDYVTDCIVWKIEDGVRDVVDGDYFPEIPIGGPVVATQTDPVNQLEWAPEFREWLSLFAQVLGTEHHLNHGPNSRQLRIEQLPMTLTEDDLLRNGNVSELRMLCGFIWRKMHDWLALDPTDDTTGWNTTELERMRNMINPIREAAGPRPSPGRLFARQDPRTWKIFQDARVRFVPDVSSVPYIPIHVPNERRLSRWELEFDLQNYDLATHYYSDTDGNGYKTSTHVALPLAKQVPLGTGDYAERKRDLQQYWVDEMYRLRRQDEIWLDPTTDDAVELIQGYRRFCEMNYLAAKNDSNWVDATLATRLGTNLIEAEDYLDLQVNPIKDRWGGSDAETAWRRGFFVYDTGMRTLARDFREFDADDGTTVSEAADTSSGDDRLTNVVVVPADRIDRTLTEAQDARDDPWLDEAATIIELEKWFGDYGD